MSGGASLRRVVAVDYGRRRIGIATCDPLGITVRGVATVWREAAAPDGALVAVARHLADLGAQVVLVGLPLHEDGSESEMSQEARAFAADLAARGPWGVELVHEGLTSWEAEARLKERGVPLEAARKDGRIDQEAAAVLLRAWLDERGGRTGA
ncbi:MAG: Holliday junction resolvase RuvX [Planctomycetota bacterium]